MRRRFTYKNNSWNVDRYLTIVSLEDGLTVSFENDLEYCINNDYNWEILKEGEESKEIDKGNRISFRANLTPTNGIGTFTINKKCNLKGNCGSLLYGNSANLYDYVPSYSFYNLFYGCDTIKEVSPYLLPFTKLGKSCYEYMFYGCTSLVNAPELPATTLKENCYSAMFEGCTSLVNAPELPATTLANGCYISMFERCTSLVNAPELPATTLAVRCYYSMFYRCTSLVNAPELPATTLVNSCYSSMFYRCTNLSYIKMLATDISATYCLYGWVNGVSSTGTFVKSKDATWDVRGVNGIPEGWTVIDDTFPTNEDGMPESTTFEFPLYFNTQIMEQTDDYLYRGRLGDPIVEAYLRFIEENANGTEWNIPESFLNDYPVYIDGYRMISGSYLFGNIENIVTAKDYGNYNELYIYIGPEELCVEGYN